MEGEGGKGRERESDTDRQRHRWGETSRQIEGTCTVLSRRLKASGIISNSRARMLIGSPTACSTVITCLHLAYGFRVREFGGSGFGFGA
jgi:hypothetical protein